MELTTLALLVLIPLLVWRIYSRLRPLFARQESLMWKHWVGAAGFPLLVLISAIATFRDVLALSCLGAGVLAGGWMGRYALSKTRIETHGIRYFFTPNARFGMVICLLFAARILSIGIELYMNRQSDFPKPLTREMVLLHPLTMASFGLLAGYFAYYSIGMLRWRRAQPPMPGLE
ncbi:hypothetical protein [Massilia endophytica]|uniref:hypothetical protein n=1 Tax=Massilia endophytica TaxID=2899220 RepID=UPI001E535BAD|nr:hypothetical protein [Massilia endophytica]UGQ46872.1 hypothetical protein LSQ66_24450 [Massilia endophytica]